MHVREPQARPLIVEKDALPDDPQDFDFTAGGGLAPTSFQLDDDGDNSNALSNTQVFPDLVRVWIRSHGAGRPGLGSAQFVL